MSRKTAVTRKAAPSVLGRYLPLIEAGLSRSALPRSSLLGRMAAYHMGWMGAHGESRASTAGKRLRPTLCLWACEAAGGQVEAALPAAVAIEWLHNFTLIHDDIQDGAGERRHRPTIWSTWGAGQAINAGDALHALAFQSLLEVGDQPARRLQAGRTIAHAVLRVIEGQSLDLALEGRPHTAPGRYMRLIRSKTGALVGASLEAGAILAGSARSLTTAFGAAGGLLGLAFQLRDDWLGIWGDPARTGKSREGDLLRRKLSHPIVAAYAIAGPDERRRLRRLYRDWAPGSEAEIRSLLVELGGPALTRGAPADVARAAVAAIRGCGIAPTYVDEFVEVADHVAQRTS